MQYPQPAITFDFILFCAFGLVIIDQLYYYWFVFAKMAYYEAPKWKQNKGAVSVVICAKNEYSNLKKNLPQILEQDYPDFEVIVVNDASNDYTHELLDDLSREYSRLKIVNIRENLNFFSGKKFALSIGIKSAKNDLLLLTDADCYPNSKHWISKMVEPFTSTKVEIVLGYGPYETRGGILNALIRFDTIHVAMQYFSFALKRKTYMGVGRNLAYRKSLFLKSSGFISHYKLMSGDDDLFINSVATKKNTRIQTHPDSYAFSEPESTYGKWMSQKRRHLSTAKYYKPKFKFLLGKYAFSQLLMYVFFTTLLVINYHILWVLGLFLIRLISQFVITKKCMDHLKEHDLLLFSPLLELMLFLNHFLLSASNVISKQNKWK